MRGGDFRKKRAAFRIEIGNDGWALPAQDPARTLIESIEGTNQRTGLFGRELIDKLNDIYTRQCRIGFELEQLPDWNNRVELSPRRDALGIRRPRIHYSISDYEAQGLRTPQRLPTSFLLSSESMTGHHRLRRLPLDFGRGSDTISRAQATLSERVVWALLHRIPWSIKISEVTIAKTCS